MKYLLDTNACIALINKRPLSVRTNFDRELSQGSDICISSVVVLELWYGVSKSQRRETNTDLLVRFLSGPVGHLAFDDEDARFAGELRAKLEAVGRRVGDYGLLIAGQALRHKMTLVTANPKEFDRIQGLLSEDWSNP